ncbi:MAG: asparagine synthase (glutamine-hydrolyzing) [bacterium TMED88]|nr:asparagine synthase (glutamine-hydrolyzing) [Deltaproteobacteria bacterium]OUV25062.1 MAG: asparagine synthase (glutamine-hydrolyzing) [bacterium TMED88]
MGRLRRMCGIAGMVSLKKGRPTDLAPVERMCDLQMHRGPDASGAWQSDDRRVALGHRRLSIIDLSASGQQPMADAQRRFHVVFNGEIYNYLELRRELEGQGAVFRTQSDTEILLVGYRVWGLQILDRMVGMFAFAIWDDQVKELLLARDPLGIKPLYYLEAPDRLLFASEIGALRAVADVGAPDPEAIAEFLLWGSIGAPRTLHSGVRALPPGTWARIQAGRFQAPHEYYRLEDQIGRVEAMDAEEAAERGRAALRSSIKRHMVADVEVGTFLSGGVDSVALTALMSEISERPVTSVNLSFRSEMLDEAPIAEQAAALYGTKHHRIDIRVDEIQERLVDAVRALDQPSIDGVNVYFVSEAAAQSGLKVAISGVGGDELFGGYGTFARTPSAVRSQAWARHIPGASMVRRSVSRALPRLIPHHLARKAAMGIRHGDSWPGVYFTQRGLFNVEQVEQLLGPNGAAVVEASWPEHQLQSRLGGRDLPEAERVSAYEIKQYLQCQLLRDTDVMSMRHSLEVRTPLVDRQLFEELMTIPAEYRHLRPAKRLLRESVSPAVPAAVWNRPKQGFAFPIDEWLAQRSVPLSLPAHPVLSEEAVRGVERDYRAGRIHWTRYWALLVLGTFLNESAA